MKNETKLRPTIDLTGEWDFAVDPDGEGFAQGWTTGRRKFDRRIRVPGAWQAQGVGEPRDYLRHHYVGWGWYRRSVDIPKDWLSPPKRDRRGLVWLRVGGAANTTRAFLNGREVGTHHGFSTPFSFDVTFAARSGSNEIVLAVFNQAQSPKDPTGCFNYHAPWGGIWQPVWLEHTADCWIEDCYVNPKLLESRVDIEIEIANPPKGGRVRFEGGGEPVESAVPATGRITLSLSLPNARLWSPEEPTLYQGRVSLLDDRGEQLDERNVRFGLRELRADGTRLLLNGRPYYLNGYGDDCVEALTGFPPADKETYRQRLATMKACGFNAVRHHSWIPCAEYFAAADEIGMLVQAELPAVYAEFFLPNAELLRQELIAALKTHRNHPSLFAVALGNEFGVSWMAEARSLAFGRAVESLYGLAKQHFQTGFIVSNSGYQLSPSDLDVVAAWDHARGDKPIIGHEVGYGCSLPDLTQLDGFTGAIQPVWLESKSEWLAQSGWEALYPDALRNSQRLLQLRRKTTIEHARLHPQLSGYHWWLGTDYPPGLEGDAWYEGVLDFFWQPKGFDPAEMRSFNNRSVLLIDAPIEVRNVWDDLGCRTELLLSHFGANDVADGRLTWRITNRAGQEQAGGEVRDIAQPVGSLRTLATIEIGSYGLTSPEELTLSAELTWAAERITNSWSFRLFPALRGTLSDSRPVRSHPDLKAARLRELYPPVAEANTRVMICDDRALNGCEFEPRVEKFLASGGRVVFLAEDVRLPSQRALQFWPGSGVGHGTFVRDHPALRGMFSSPYCDELYFRLFGEGVGLRLDSMPGNFAPIIGAIGQEGGHREKDKRLAKFGMLLEGTVNGGKLLLTTFRVIRALSNDWWATGDPRKEWPEARHLVESLIAYACSDAFDPKQDLAPLFSGLSKKSLN